MYTLLALLTAFTALVLLIGLLRPSLIIRFLVAPLLPQVLFCGGGRRREISITIDDGPSEQIDTGAHGASSPGSQALLDLLRELKVPATLFLISGHLEHASPEFIRHALADGHRIGNHMTEDSVSALLSPDRFRTQLESAEKALRGAAAPNKLPRPLQWFRPGGGWFRPSMLRALKVREYRLVLGSVFPWDTFHPPLAFLRWFVLTNSHPGAIIVLHDRKDTLSATLSVLRTIVPELQRRGYHFVSLADLLAG